MRFKMWAAALVVALLVTGSVSALTSDVVLVDARDFSYLRSGSEVPSMAQNQLSSVLAALTGMLPAHHIDPTLSQTLEGLLKPSAFRKPKAHVLLHVAGLTQGDVQACLPEQRQQRLVHVAVETGSSAAHAVLDAYSLVMQANPDADAVSIADLAIEACDTACLERSFVEALSSVGASYDTGIRHLEGIATFASGAQLNLATREGRLFAVELATLQQALNVLSPRQSKQQVYEMSLLSLQGLAQAYGAEHPAVAAAKEVTQALLKQSVTVLDQAYDGDATFQLSLMSLSREESGLHQLHGLKDHTRRALMNAANLTAAEDLAQALTFSTKAAGYGSLVFLTYFSFAAIYCMCYMPFKKDTLLYGSSKKYE